MNVFRFLPVTRATLHVQPTTGTLIGLPTNFWTSVEPIDFRNQNVVVETIDFRATPESFVWHFGDGSSLTTSEPGAPYPALDVTHTYTEAGLSRTPSVDVIWRGEYRRTSDAADAGWHDVPERVTATGPPVDLQIVTARAELVQDPS